MAAASPLKPLSLSAQNTKHKTPAPADHRQSPNFEKVQTQPHSELISYDMSTGSYQDASENEGLEDIPTKASPHPLVTASKGSSSSTSSSPVKASSPTGIPSGHQDLKLPQSTFPQLTPPSNESLPQTNEISETETETEARSTHPGDEELSKIQHDGPHTNDDDVAFNPDITLDADDTTHDISTFSAIPDVDLTRFAAPRNAAETPTKPDVKGWSPSKQLHHLAAPTPGAIKRPLQLSRNGFQNDASLDDNDITPRRPISALPAEDLLNFTGQSNVFIPPPPSSSGAGHLRRSPSGRGGFPIKINPSPSHRSQASVDRERSRGGGVISPVKQEAATISTPVNERRMSHILDFDLEPLATPRSIPSITPRELESLRSELSSQISSLSATLSGKEAEVLALKRAITDAEVRVGNTSEEVRNERLLREVLEQERQDWERQGREMEAVLREIRQEIMVGEHERDKLRRQTEEAEKSTEEMEVRVVELETRLESANRRATTSPTSSPKKWAEAGEQPVTPLAVGNGSVIHGMDINEAVREATERVARDLHGLYKSKHETKVAALKRSYEARWEKKVRHLENDLRHANEEITGLKSQNESTSVGQQQWEQRQSVEEKRKRAEEIEHTEAEKQILLARLEGMQSEIKSVRQESSDLRDQVERERVEKGELVAQVDLFLALGDGDQAASAQQQQHGKPRLPSSSKRNSMAAVEPGARSMSTDSIIQDPSNKIDLNHHNSNYSSYNYNNIKPSTSTTITTPQTRHPQHRQSQSQSQSQLQLHSPSRPTPPRRTTTTTSTTSTARPRPTSMLQAPGKFSSGIPGPGARSTGLSGILAGKNYSAVSAGTAGTGAGTAGGGRFGVAGVGTGAGAGGIMEGITRMGLGNAGAGAGAGAGSGAGSR